MAVSQWSCKVMKQRERERERGRERGRQREKKREKEGARGRREREMQSVALWLQQSVRQVGGGVRVAEVLQGDVAWQLYLL